MLASSASTAPIPGFIGLVEPITTIPSPRARITVKAMIGAFGTWLIGNASMPILISHCA